MRLIAGLMSTLFWATCLGSFTSRAQELPPIDTKTPAPRLPDGAPDLSGPWIGGFPSIAIADGLPPGETIPILPAANAILKSRLAKDDPVYNCLPAGVPRANFLPWRIVQTPKRVYFLYEGAMHTYREIYLDRNSHPTGDRLNPTWFGDSIGRWEGDTLIVDTVGFNGRSWLDGLGHPTTEQLHVVERFSRLSLGVLRNVITVDDPGAYSRPFTVTFNARLLAGWELMEYVCNENYKTEHMVGPPTRDAPNPANGAPK